MHIFSLPIKCVTKTKLIYAIKTDNRAVSEGSPDCCFSHYFKISKLELWLKERHFLCTCCKIRH